MVQKKQSSHTQSGCQELSSNRKKNGDPNADDDDDDVPYGRMIQLVGDPNPRMVYSLHCQMFQIDPIKYPIFDIKDVHKITKLKALRRLNAAMGGFQICFTLFQVSCAK